MLTYEFATDACSDLSISLDIAMYIALSGYSRLRLQYCNQIPCTGAANNSVHCPHLVHIAKAPTQTIQCPMYTLLQYKCFNGVR